MKTTKARGTTVAASGYTPSVAAALTASKAKWIRKLIERKMLPARRSQGQRWLDLSGLLYIEVLRDVGPALSPAGQTRLYATLRGTVEQPRDLTRVPAWVTVSGVEVPVQPSAERLRARLRAVTDAERYVQRTPEVLGGEPVVRGTRVPVYTLAALHRSGETIDALRAAYPRVSADALRAVLLWAQANPARGRPRSPRAA